MFIYIIISFHDHEVNLLEVKVALPPLQNYRTTSTDHQVIMNNTIKSSSFCFQSHIINLIFMLVIEYNFSVVHMLPKYLLSIYWTNNVPIRLILFVRRYEIFTITNLNIQFNIITTYFFFIKVKLNFNVQLQIKIKAFWKYIYIHINIIKFRIN